MLAQSVSSSSTKEPRNVVPKKTIVVVIAAALGVAKILWATKSNPKHDYPNKKMMSQSIGMDSVWKTLIHSTRTEPVTMAKLTIV